MADVNLENLKEIKFSLWRDADASIQLIELRIENKWTWPEQNETELEKCEERAKGDEKKQTYSYSWS